MEYIGIDVHQRDSQVCIVGERGGVHLERRVRTSRERLRTLLGARPRARILLEASTDSEWVAQALETVQFVGQDAPLVAPVRRRAVPTSPN